MLGNKERVLQLLAYLEKYTDEDHTVTTSEIIQMFSDGEHSLNRKTVAADIECLQEQGFDIIKTGTRENAYFMGGRNFEVPELKLLIDAVSASPFISKKKSHELITKLTGFASKGQASQLKRHLYTADAVKPLTSQIYYTVDTINEAINREKKICFKYYEYLPTKKRVFRHGGKVYVESPYGLVWYGNHYYMIGWSETLGDIVQFRVDRMCGARILEDEQAVMPEGFSIDEYVQSKYGMYGGSATRHVTLLCNNERMDSIIDQFGEHVRTSVADRDHFIAEVVVSPSPNFYADIFRYHTEIMITAPDDIVAEYKSWLQRALRQYRKK